MVKWMKMGDKMAPRNKVDRHGKLLTISAVEERDGGKYMCTAENSAGEAVHYFDVIVEGRSTPGTNCACICWCVCFWLKESYWHRDPKLFWLRPTLLCLTSPRAAKVADRASSGPADCDWIWCSHQVLSHWKTTTRHNVEEERRTVQRWVGMIWAVVFLHPCQWEGGQCNQQLHQISSTQLWISQVADPLEVLQSSWDGLDSLTGRICIFLEFRTQKKCLCFTA